LTAVPAQNVVAKQVTGQIVQAVSGEWGQWSECAWF
jgi:hypothetical protein